MIPGIGLSMLNIGCNIVNPPEKIPTYIRIDSFSANPSEIPTKNINTAWVYLDNQVQGVYELPATIPLVVEGTGTVLINAGVDFTGYSGYKVIYPFYTYDSFTLAAQPGKTINYTPSVKYISGATVRYKEDFELVNTFEPFNPDIADDTSIVRTNDPSLVWSGTGRSGYIYLTPSNYYSQNINNKSFPIKKGDAYIEIDYKCSVEFRVGLQAIANTGDPVYESIATIKPSDTWKKLYVGVQEFIGRFNSGEYRVIILADLPEGQSEGYVLVDNIKVISY